jgi:hypothetical protein
VELYFTNTATINQNTFQMILLEVYCKGVVSFQTTVSGSNCQFYKNSVINYSNFHFSFCVFLLIFVLLCTYSVLLANV